MNDKILVSYHDAYRYGAISAIVGCVLSLFNLIEWHWFFVLVVFYGAGVAIWFTKSDEHLQLTEPQQTLSTASPPPLVEKPPIQPIPVRQATVNHSLPYQQLFQNYERLQQHSTSFLNIKSQYYMTEIQKIMQFIKLKMDQDSNENFKLEIIDIQRTLNAYLVPALQHFSDLPHFLRERKIIDQQSPSELLEQQLAMILDEFQNIAESIYLNDLNKLIDHGQYLKYKLKQQDSFRISPTAIDDSP